VALLTAYARTPHRQRARTAARARTTRRLRPHPAAGEAHARSRICCAPPGTAPDLGGHAALGALRRVAGASRPLLPSSSRPAVHVSPESLRCEERRRQLVWGGGCAAWGEHARTHAHRAAPAEVMGANDERERPPPEPLSTRPTPCLATATCWQTNCVQPRSGGGLRRARPCGARRLLPCPRQMRARRGCGGVPSPLCSETERLLPSFLLPLFLPT